MLITNGACSSRADSGPSRLSFAASTATTARSPGPGAVPRKMPANSMNWYSFGIGTSPKRYISASLPSSRRASVVASSEPSASPSGFSWVVTMNLSRSRIAATTWPSSAASLVFVWVGLIDEPGEAHPPLHRRIVLEGQLWSSLQMKLAVDELLQHPVGGLEAGQCGVALSLGAEDAHEDGRLAEVRARVHPGDRDEPDARILERTDPFREHLAERLVHTPHASAHSKVTTWRSTGPSPHAWGPRCRSARSRSSCSSLCPRATQASVSLARCQASWWSTSATEAPNRRWSCAFTDRSSFRFPLREWFSGKWSSAERMPT